LNPLPGLLTHTPLSYSPQAGMAKDKLVPQKLLSPAEPKQRATIISHLMVSGYSQVMMFSALNLFPAR